MLRGRRCLVLVVFLVAAPQTVAFAQSSVDAPSFDAACKDNDRKCAAAKRAQSPIKEMSFWRSAFSKPIEKRIGRAPDELVTYLVLDNIAGGIPNRPRAATPPVDFLKDVNDALAELPQQISRLASEKLAGIYFVSDLGGTGYTDYIKSNHSISSAGFIVLDIDIMSKSTANTWATWKEQTPFNANPAYRLEATIEASGSNNRSNAIQYILLHELGHILSIGEKIHPPWDRPGDLPSLEKYPFAKLSWQTSFRDGRYVSRFEPEFPLRKKVVYYFGARLNGGQMVDAYRQVESTNFPTLYAATNPADDFAESFASYVHTILLKRPFEIDIYHDGKIAMIYRSCWDEERCAVKRRFLEDLLKSP